MNYTMPKEKAESIIASLLALDTVKWMATMKDDPRMTQLAREAISRNRDVAISMGIDNLYSIKLQYHIT